MKGWIAVAGSLLIAVASLTGSFAQPIETVVYCEDFESGPGGWFAQDTDLISRPMDIFWHLDSGAWSCTADAAPCWGCPGQGYGNNWEQLLSKSYALPAVGAKIDFDHEYDTEAGFDICSVEVLPQGGSEYVTLAEFSGDSGGVVMSTVDLSAYGGTTVDIRFHFSSEGSFSDEDGLLCTDGAWRIESLQVAGHPAEDFSVDGEGWVGSILPLGPTLATFRLEPDPICTPAPYLDPETALVCEHPSTCGGGGPGGSAWVAYDPVTEVIPEIPEDYNRIFRVGIESPAIPIPAPVGTPEYRLELDLFSDQEFAATRIVWQDNYAYSVPGDTCSAEDFTQEFSWHSFGTAVGWTPVSHLFTDEVPDGASDVTLRLNVGDWVNLTGATPGTGGRGRGPYFDNIRIVHATAPPGPPWVECRPWWTAAGVVPDIALGGFVTRVLDDTTRIDDLVFTQDPAPGATFECAAPLTINVTDQDGLTSEDCVTILLEDPYWAITASPEMLWPPNHRMVSVTVSAENPCDNGVEYPCRIDRVTSNEPAGHDGSPKNDLEPDWEITGDLTVDLRAERDGEETGRVYTIYMDCGTSVEVTVPVSMGK